MTIKSDNPPTNKPLSNAAARQLPQSVQILSRSGSVLTNARHKTDMVSTDTMLNIHQKTFPPRKSLSLPVNRSAAFSSFPSMTPSSFVPFVLFVASQPNPQPIPFE
jgi:hypothetical protein